MLKVLEVKPEAPCNMKNFPPKTQKFPQKYLKTSKISSESAKIEFSTPDLPQETLKSP